MDQKLELNIVPRTKVRGQLLGSSHGEAFMCFFRALCFVLWHFWLWRCVQSSGLGLLYTCASCEIFILARAMDNVVFVFLASCMVITRWSC